MAATRNVFTQVLPEVDELQSRANGIALRQCLGIVDAIQMQQQAPYRVGRAAAVVQQVFALGVGGGIACFLDVLNECAQQVVQQRERQLMLLHLVLQRCKDVAPACRCWRTCGYCVQSAAIAVQGIQALLRAGITFVGNIVSSACERVDGRYWLAQRGRA